MAGKEDLAKYIAARAIAFIDTPKEERMQQKQNRKRQKESWTFRWFGVVPFGLYMWYRQMRGKNVENEHY